MRERILFDRMDQPARLAAGRNQVIPASRREMTALAIDLGDVRRDGVDAAEVVEQPGVERVGAQRRLDRSDVQP